MNDKQEPITIEIIPVDQIAIINPRIRNRRIFREIVDSISEVGLKRPITVSRRGKKNGKQPYQLVCGQGRLEAFISRGQKEIPAVGKRVKYVDSQIMSLVVNHARRRHTACIE